MFQKYFNNKIIKVGLFILPVLTLMFVLREIIFFGGMFFNGDAVLQFYLYLQRASTQQNFIVYEMLSGFPLYASVGVGWFYPISNWFADKLGFIEGYNVLTLGNFILAYIFAYIYARKIQIRRIASIVTATVYAFSAHMFVWGSLLLNSNYFAILPAVLWLAECIKKRPSSKKDIFVHIGVTIVIGILLGSMWRSSHSQFVVYIHAFFGIYLLFLAWQNNIKQHFMRFAGYMLGSFGISLAVGWVQIIAVLSLREVTSRASGTSITEFFTGQFGIPDIVHYVLPFWNNPIIPTGSPNVYIGIIPFILLLFALINWKHIKKVSPYMHFALITYVGALLLSINYSPLAWLLHKLPLFDSFRGAQRIMFIGNFGVAVAVGFAIDYFIQNREQAYNSIFKLIQVLKKIVLYVALPIIAIVSVANMFFFDKLRIAIEQYFLKNIYSQTSGLPKEHYLQLINSYLTDTLDQISIWDTQVLIFLGISICGYYIFKNSNVWSYKKIATSIAVVTVINFTLVYANYFPTVPSNVFTSPSSTANFILKHSKDKGQFRVFSLFSGLTEYNELTVRCPQSSPTEIMELQKALLTPNLNLQYGLDSPDGYENYMTRRLSYVLAYAGSDRATVGDMLVNTSVPIEKRIEMFTERKNILRAMNVRYVISHYEIPDEDFILVNSSTVGACQTKVFIYELKDTWPRYFLTTNVSNIEDDNFELFTKHIEESQTIGHVVVEESKYKYNNEQDIIPVNVRIEGDRLRMNVSTPNDAILYVSNTWLPGWHATINGVPVQILKAQYAFMAVPVPAGDSEIVFTYIK